MNEPKFTPGPWWTNGREVGDVPMMAVKISNCISGATPEEAKANAYLIASSPELYTALSDLILGTPIGSQNRDDDGLTAYPRGLEKRIERAISALKKARGEK